MEGERGRDNADRKDGRRPAEHASGGVCSLRVGGPAIADVVATRERALDAGAAAWRVSAPAQTEQRRCGCCALLHRPRRRSPVTIGPWSHPQARHRTIGLPAFWLARRLAGSIALGRLVPMTVSITSSSRDGAADRTPRPVVQRSRRRMTASGII
jgi:hypothetical protein